MNEINVILTYSNSLNSREAVSELIKGAAKEAGGTQPTAGIMFAGIDHDHNTLLEGIIEKWPGLDLIGCTTDGEMSSLSGYSEDSVVLMLFVSEKNSIVSGVIHNDAGDLESEVKSRINETCGKLNGEPSFCILFSNVLEYNGETILHMVNESFNNKIPVFGGASADSWRFSTSRQFYKEDSADSISPFIIFSGIENFGFSVDSGWKPLGEFGLVTRSEGNIIYEIDNEPAVNYYKKILGKGMSPSIELPLAVYDLDEKFMFLRATPDNCIMEDGAVKYLGNVEVNSRIKITSVNRDGIIAASRKAVLSARKMFGEEGKPVAALCFTCSARRLLLGTRTCEEYEVIRDILGESVRFIGFYTYGEFCPLCREGKSEFHNETFTILLF